MSQAPTVNRQWPRKRTAAPERKSKRRYVIWVLGSLSILLLSGLGIAWATGYFDPNPRIAEINQLVGQMQDGNRKDRRESFEKMRKDMEGLSDAEKKAVWERMRRCAWRKRKNVWRPFSRCRPTNRRPRSRKKSNVGSDDRRKWKNEWRRPPPIQINPMGVLPRRKMARAIIKGQEAGGLGDR